MPDRWLDLDWSGMPRTRDPEVAAWTAATLARIAEGGREEEVAKHRRRMAECATVPRSLNDSLLRT